MRTGIVVVILAVIALIWFNPDMGDFRLFIETHTEELIQGETGDTALGGALSELGSRLAGSYVSRITERNNYVVFSTYTVDLDGEAGDENEWRFVGIAGRFIETNRPPALSDRE